MRRRLEQETWQIAVVDRYDQHHYQPGYLFLPFGEHSPRQVVRQRHTFIPDGVELVLNEIERVDADAHRARISTTRRPRAARS
jgi:sulfide:quinone oxidoreductase